MRFYILILVLAAMFIAGCGEEYGSSDSYYSDPSYGDSSGSGSGTGGVGSGGGGGSSGSYDPPDNIAPELSSMILFGTGLLALAAYRKFRRRKRNVINRKDS